MPAPPEIRRLAARCWLKVYLGLEPQYPLEKTGDCDTQLLCPDCQVWSPSEIWMAGRSPAEERSVCKSCGREMVMCSAKRLGLAPVGWDC